MNDQDSWTLRNVIVMALADGEVAQEEKDFIDRLRVKLGIDEGQLRELCKQVRQEGRRIKLPSSPSEAQEVVGLLVEVAAADGEISQVERRALGRIAKFTGLAPSALEAMIAAAAAGDPTPVLAAVEEVYEQFGGWDPPVRQEKFTAIGEFGPTAVVPLMRMLESYRVPDGVADALEMKVFVIDQLAALADDRAVYYFAQQVALSGADQVTNPDVRAAAAEGMGRIAGEAITRDEDGVDVARQWWLKTGMTTYDTLTL